MAELQLGGFLDKASVKRAVKGVTILNQDGTVASLGGGALSAGENHIGQVGGTTQVSSATPIVSTAAYASGDIIGTLMTFAGMARASGGTGMLQDVVIHSKSLQSFAAELWVFHTNPAGTTVTDNAVFDLAAVDYDKVATVIPVFTWYNGGATRCICTAPQLARAYKVGTGTDLFGILVARATPTLASTSDLKVVVKGLLN